jgi:macrodomain Ter protein organizer (MatP/YcbG family)
MPAKRSAPLARAEEKQEESEGLRALKRLDAGTGKKGDASPAKLLAEAWAQRHSAPRLVFRASQTVRARRFRSGASRCCRGAVMA